MVLENICSVFATLDCSQRQDKTRQSIEMQSREIETIKHCFLPKMLYENVCTRGGQNIPYLVFNTVLDKNVRPLGLRPYEFTSFFWRSNMKTVKAFLALFALHSWDLFYNPYPNFLWYHPHPNSHSFRVKMMSKRENFRLFKSFA